MVNIQEATLHDKAEIADFQMKMAVETEGLTLDPVVLKQGVASVFNDAAKGKYFIAKDEDKTIGALMITYEWSDWRNGWVWWIQSVYILEDYRKKGVFKEMYLYIQKAAKKAKVRGLRLYVDKSNTGAQAVYKAIGMDGEHYTLYEWMP